MPEVPELPQDQHVCLGPGAGLRPVSTLLGPRLGNQRVVLGGPEGDKKGLHGECV